MALTPETAEVRQEMREWEWDGDTFKWEEAKEPEGKAIL